MNRYALLVAAALALPVGAEQVVGLSFQSIPTADGTPHLSTHPRSCWSDGVFQAWLPACAPVRGEARAMAPAPPVAQDAAPPAIETRAERRKRLMGGPMEPNKPPDFSRMLRAIDRIGAPPASPVSGFMP